MARDDRTRSRLSRFMRTDDMGGGMWVRWGLLSHGMVVCLPMGLVRAVREGGSAGEILGITGAWLASIASTVAFWYFARRTWDRLPDRLHPVPPAQADPRDVVYDAGGNARDRDGTVRRLA